MFKRPSAIVIAIVFGCQLMAVSGFNKVPKVESPLEYGFKAQPYSFLLK